VLNGLPNARLQKLAAFRRRKIKIGVTNILRLCFGHRGRGGHHKAGKGQR
jgi:hypothetical protein